MASSDIVERLRPWPHVDCAGDMIDEAAAEIERLKAAHDHQYNMAGLMLREAERVGIENEKLRELLTLAGMYVNPHIHTHADAMKLWERIDEALK